MLGFTYDAENRLVLVRNIDALAAACDVDLAFTTYGDATWSAQSDEYYNDNDAAQSGAIGASEETWLQTTVIGPGNISFYCKLASASEDALTFYIDDTFPDYLDVRHDLEHYRELHYQRQCPACPKMEIQQDQHRLLGRNYLGRQHLVEWASASIHEEIMCLCSDSPACVWKAA